MNFERLRRHDQQYSVLQKRGFASYALVTRQNGVRKSSLNYLDETLGYQGSVGQAHDGSFPIAIQSQYLNQM